eukprot:3082536-Amphidinium_carterae.1
MRLYIAWRSAVKLTLYTPKKGWLVNTGTKTSHKEGMQRWRCAIWASFPTYLVCPTYTQEDMSEVRVNGP